MGCDELRGMVYEQEGTEWLALPTTLAAKRFKCPVPDCKAAFPTKQRLKQHGISHSGARPFACNFAECKSTFKRLAHLRSHELTHSETKPHVCVNGECRTAFRQKSELQKHTRRHLRIRPHKCKFPGCRAAFATACHLRDHENTHTGSKPYSSTHEGCRSSFAQHAHLVVHTRTHTGELPYNCPAPDCEAAFTTSGECKKHQYYHHTQEGQHHRKKEEERIAKVLESAGVDFKREHHVSFSCNGGTYARTDFIIIEGGKVIVLEVDEDQHQWYAVACEVSRMAKLFEAWLLEGNALPVYFIRYNPNAFRVDGKKAKVAKKLREARLLEAIQEAAESEGDGMRVRYMYYDVVSGKPAIMQDPAFTIDDCCVEAIV